MDPLTQGQQASAETTQNGNESQSNQTEGFQKRIDEITAARRAAEEQLVQMAAQNQQLMAAYAEMAQKSVAPSEPIAPPEPEQLMKQMQAQMQQMQQQMLQMQQVNGQQAFRQAVVEVQDQRVTTLAQKYWQEAVAKGYTGPNGWTPEQVMKLAAGEVFLADQKKAALAGQARAGFSGGPGVLMGQSGVPSVTQQSNGTTRLSDADVARLHPVARAKYYSDLVGDSPL